MNPRAWTPLVPAVLLASILGGCDWHLPGKPVKPVEPTIGSREHFDRVYFVNCLGCHGPDGRNGPARPMNDPLYLASIPDQTFEKVVEDGHGVLMPGFRKTAFSGLSSEEITAFTTSIKTYWGDPKLSVTDLPPYAQPAGAGDPTAGKATFATFCGACHGADGAGKEDGAGSVVNRFYLELVSDQALRSTVLFGRTDLGCPSSQGPYPGQPKDRGLTPTEINDVTAWLVSNRVSVSQEAKR
ncbi:MAG: c-type cytochrome [Planctomycetota bacterium]|nr:c-type cytochrome [Planctomycetota bacterium]